MANEWQQTTRDVPWQEPHDAFGKLSHLQPLMLDGMGAHPEARYASIALASRFELRCDGEWSRHGEGVAPLPGPPLEVLQRELDAWRIPVPSGPTFAGGFIGYFAYEFTQHIEPTLKFHRADTPEAVLRLCTDAMVFDRHEQRCWLVANDERGEGSQRLDAYEDTLAQAGAAVGSVPDAKWSTAMDQATFEANVVRIKQHIQHGDLFQANIATRFDATMDVEPLALYRQFIANNPSPYMALMPFDDHGIVSASPEQLLSIHDGWARTRPIAGTRPRGATDTEDAAHEADLLADEKEQAEHTMLVDLLRNDIAKIAKPGTTEVAESMSVERYQRVMHLVSRVQGRVADVTATEAIAALFPGGTITGAPKHRACMRIQEAEAVARGPYTGSAGYIDFSHNIHLNIMIRTLLCKDGKVSVHAGSGIVADSNPESEWHEAGHKASALLANHPPATRLGEVTRHGWWKQDKPTAQVDARVLLVDNYDSFVHNLADYCRAHGAEVHVVRNDVDLDAALACKPTHIILGPGPGWPKESGITQDLASSLDVPTLGVCLGHQAMAEAHGGQVMVGPTIHGKTSPVNHDNSTLFAGMPSPCQATRYHSLIVEAPPGWRVTATYDDIVMAMEHPTKPAFGLQFHPESFRTEQGLDIIRRFLQT